MTWKRPLRIACGLLAVSLPLLGCGVVAWAASPLLALLAVIVIAACSGSGREGLGPDTTGVDSVVTEDTSSSGEDLEVGDIEMGDEEDLVEPAQDLVVDVPDPGKIDTDQDGIADDEDNCPLVPNPEQEDADASGYGDACEALEFISPCCGAECFLDSDGDMVPDVLDLCPWTAGLDGFEGNVDSDGDGVGDDCDTTDDADADGIPDLEDNCPLVANPGQENSDGADGCDIHGDACDLCEGPECLTPCGEHCCYDADGDGFPGGWLPPEPISCGGLANSDDNCPLMANEDQADKDLDGIGDVCDNCPDEPNPEQWDVNGDGLGDACSSADLSWQERRRESLAGFLVHGAISPETFLLSYGGEPQAARTALAQALRRKFVDRGVLPNVG